jgi:hypothetical protein
MRVRVLALVVLALLTACGKAPVAKAPPPPPHVPAGVFDPSKLDLDRPCSLVTAQDAANVSGAPFFRTIAADTVDEDTVRCSQGVGDYGLHGLVEVEVRYPQPGAPAQAIFDIQCRTPAQPAEIEDAPPVDANAPPPPDISGHFCSLQNGTYAVLLPDRVLTMRVRLSAGEIDPAASRKLAALVSARVVRN